MLQTGGFQVTQNLRLVFAGQRLRGLQLDNQLPFDQQIREVITDQRAILVINLDGLLLCHLRPAFRRRCASAFSYTFSKCPCP